MNGETLAKIIVADLGLPTSYEIEIFNQVKNALFNVKKSSIIQNPNTQLFKNSSQQDDMYFFQNEEKIATIFIDVKKDGIHYKDKFEWDIYNKENDIEEFTQLLIEDIGLPQSFHKLIHFQIIRQVDFLLLIKV